MNEKKISTKSQKGLISTSVPVKSGVMSSKGEFEIPYEAACSPEFKEGCIVREDEEDKELEEK